MISCSTVARIHIISVPFAIVWHVLMFGMTNSVWFQWVYEELCIPRPREKYIYI